MLASISSSSLLLSAFLPGQLEVLSIFSSLIHLNPFPPFIPPNRILGRKGRDGLTVFTSSNLLWFCLFNLNPVTVTFSGDSQNSCFTSANKRAALVSKGQAGGEIQNCHMLSNIVLCLPVLGEGRRPESAAQPASEDVGTLQDSRFSVWTRYCYSKLTSGCSNIHCLFCCPQ